jgi:hypothetical protein
MTFLRNAVSRSTAALYGALAAASASPALAQDTLSSLHIPRLSQALGSLTPRDMLLYGSIVLLAVTLGLRAARGRPDHTPVAEGPDMRWWKNA